MTTPQRPWIPDDQLSRPAVSTMTAVVQRRYGPPSVLSLDTLPIPAPAPDEVLVRVEASSVNAQDWHIMRGEPRIARAIAPAFFRLHRPRIPVRGTDLVGLVVAVGDGVAQWAPGDRVFGQGTGAFAEYAVARADELALLPVGLDVAAAAALPLAGSTALQCLDVAEAQAGDSILINGASGGVGSFAVQVARSMGMRVTAVTSPRNVEQAQRLGAREVVDYTRQDFVASGAQYDVVLDLVGNRSLGDLRQTVRSGGALVLSGGGVPGRGRNVGPFALLVRAQLAAHKADIAIHVPKAVPTSTRLEKLAALVEGGEVVPALDRRYPLSQTADAIAYVETVHPQGKVVIDVL